MNICICCEVSAADIEEVVARGITKIEEVLDETGAAGCCGECLGNVQAVVSTSIQKLGVK